MRSWRSLVPLLLISVVGCSSDSSPTAPAGPVSFSHTGVPDISGSVFLGARQRSICSTLPASSPLVVRALGTDGSFFDPAFLNCPANDFSLPTPAGSYLLRVTLPSDPALGQLPARWLEPGVVSVDATDVLKNVHVQNGSPLGGGATLDGVPIAGVGLTVVYNSLPFAGAAFGASGSTGRWEEDFGRQLILQNDVEYVFSGCPGLPVPGIKSFSGFPTEPVLFPSGGNRVDCDFTTGDALRYTHRANRLKLTSFPGDIGGMSDPIIFPDLGYGYSAQFPLPAGDPPRAGPDFVNRQLFRGGLVLAVAPDIALGGTELQGYVFCSVAPCRALGLDGQAAVTELAGERKDITWTYTDAGSQRPKGLHVVQRSFEGQAGADYVLYAFRITNQGPSQITFTPGLFLDFDVSPDLASNIGYTELDGQLMITTSTDDLGRHLGSVIVNSPPGGRNYFFLPALSESDVVAAMRGAISNPTIDATDVSTLHAGITVTLKRRRTADFWAAVVAGDDRTETIANARAAIADARARQLSGDPFAATTTASVKLKTGGTGGRAAATGRGWRICKRNCGPD
jgi:hypothetical protein